MPRNNHMNCYRLSGGCCTSPLKLELWKAALKFNRKLKSLNILNNSNISWGKYLDIAEQMR